MIEKRTILKSTEKQRPIDSVMNKPVLPIDKNSAVLSEKEKIEKIESHFASIMEILGLNLKDESLKDTPKRVAKMYVQEIFSGLDPNNKPEISLFSNDYGYHGLMVEKNITLFSNCEHHFVPIIGKVHVAYLPHDKVIGLSKINRLVKFYARRPQVQERLTMEIHAGLCEIFGHEDVAVFIEADHMCVASRGIEDTKSSTLTEVYTGAFKNENTKQRFLTQIGF